MELGVRGFGRYETKVIKLLKLLKVPVSVTQISLRHEPQAFNWVEPDDPSGRSPISHVMPWV